MSAYNTKECEKLFPYNDQVATTVFLHFVGLYKLPIWKGLVAGAFGPENLQQVCEFRRRKPSRQAHYQLDETF